MSTPASGAETAAVLIDNRSELPDDVVQEAVQTYFTEHGSFMGQAQPSYSTYNGGSLMNRQKFKVPANVREEIILSRDLAERDDDVAATLGQMIGTAFGDGMQHQHPDEQTGVLFNRIAKKANLDAIFAEIYREYLIASQVTTVHLYTRDQYDFTPEGGDGRARKTFSIASPLVGVLPAENIKVLANDTFKNSELAYDVTDNPPLKSWAEEFFAANTSAGRRAELRKADPVSAQLFLGPVSFIEPGTSAIGGGLIVYALNPRMIARTTMAKGSWPHPRPLLTRNFALLEAKRLLNLMDHALLQGGVNFIVVAKKGSDARPALPEEVSNLKDVVAGASRSGVIVGDHRLSFEIITPNLEALLSPGKRRLIGRKLAAALLRVPEHATEEAAQEGMKAELEFIQRTISFDRRQIRRHVENFIYDEIVDRNKQTFQAGPPTIWFPKIILQGTQYFTDYVIKLRDRGDIPRKYAVEAAGFNYEAGLGQRQREVERGDDETLAPASVPFSSPDAGPQDNNDGRPRGSGPNNGAPGASRGNGQDPARPRGAISRNAGETVRAQWDEEHGVYRAGERTQAVLDTYADTATIGRITDFEREALGSDEVSVHGPVTVVPTNVHYETGEARVVRLATGLSMIVANRSVDGALVAKALCFRRPEFDVADAEEMALAWGFPIDEREPPEADPPATD